MLLFFCERERVRERERGGLRNVLRNRELETFSNILEGFKKVRFFWKIIYRVQYPLFSKIYF